MVCFMRLNGLWWNLLRRADGSALCIERDGAKISVGTSALRREVWEGGWLGELGCGASKAGLGSGLSSGATEI
jgi:hypothetical protein